jgi:hypothetical protein
VSPVLPSAGVCSLRSRRRRVRGPRLPVTVMLNAHHSISADWTLFGLYPAMAREMVEWARARLDLRFVFSPHPSLLTVMESAQSPLSPESVADFSEEWSALPTRKPRQHRSHRGDRRGNLGDRRQALRRTPATESVRGVVPAPRAETVCRLEGLQELGRWGAHSGRTGPSRDG